MRLYFAEEVKSAIDKNHKPAHKQNDNEDDSIDI